MRRRGVLALPLLASPSIAKGQVWPDRFIKVIVPVPPGGSVDTLARVLSRPLGDALDQPVVIENRTGAGGNIAFEMVANSPPDGHTILAAWDPIAINPALYSEVAYDPLRDFEPIIQTVRAPQLLVVRPDLPADNLARFLNLAKEQDLMVGSPGNGSVGHLAAELLRSRSGGRWTHVPYRGGGPAMTDLLAGTIDALCLTLPAAAEHVRAGRMRPLAVTSASRARALPEVPTVAEAGFPEFEVISWQGWLAPAGTPAFIPQRLNAEINEILGTTDVAHYLERHGFERVGGDASVLARTLATDVARWPALARAAGARVE